MNLFFRLKSLKIVFSMINGEDAYADTVDLTKKLGRVPCAKGRKLLFLLIQKAD